jgi:two-component system, NtrC family, sensor kinase
MTSSERYRTFYCLFREISKVVHSKTHINEILELVVSRVAQGLDAKGTFLCVWNRDTGDFQIKSSYGMAEKIANLYLTLNPVTGKKFLHFAVEGDETHVIKDIFNSPRVKYPQQAWDEGVRIMIDVPLLLNGKMFGFIRVFLADQKDVSNDEIDFIKAVAEQCTCAIDHDDEIKSHIIQFNRLATKVDKMSALGRMAAGIAHEINNPLTGILLYSSNLLKKVPDTGHLSDGLKIIIQETQRCKTTIQGLLDFSREKLPQKVDTNINAVIEKALALMENEFLIRRIDVVKDLDPVIESIPLDGNQIEQVLINLLLNAEHAIEKNGMITIRSRKEQNSNRITVEVEDNGCGIPQTNLKRIFEPFYTTKPDGTGLGLAVSYGIIKNHQGTVEIFSEIGTGTMIIIALPILCETNRTTGKVN